MKRFLVLVALVTAGCLSPSPPGSDSVDPVQMRVDLSTGTTGPGEVLRGNVTVTNAGDAAVRHYGYCDPPIALAFLGPDGKEVAVERPVARCEALSVETLAPGASKSVAFTFDGRLWEGDTPSAAPPGTYTVVATFRYWADDAAREPLDVPEDVRTIESRATWTHAGGAGDVRVDVETSRADDGVRVVATATNTGETPRTYDANPCSGLRFRFLDPDGREHALREPPGCTRELRPTELRPGESLVAEATFDGNVWREGATGEAEEGEWRVEAYVVTWRADMQDAQEAHGSATFRWSSSPPSGGIAAGGPEVELTVDRASFAAGEEVTVNATATNQGERAVWINGICGGPYRFAVLDAEGEEVPFREPIVTCLALRSEPFGPGERRFAEVTWDGRVHGEDGVRDAPPGTYTFVVTFVWWDSPEFAGEPRSSEARVDVEFTG